MTRSPGDKRSKRKAIIRDWQDGYSPRGSARMRGCSLRFVLFIREEDRQRRLQAHRTRRRMAMNGAVVA